VEIRHSIISGSRLRRDRATHSGIGSWRFFCSIILNGHSGIKSGKRGTARGSARFHAGEESLRSYPMRKIVLTLAALAATG